MSRGQRIFGQQLYRSFAKKFDGTGDPYEHVALFNQLIYAEGVTDVHTKVHGFGLTLSESALSWFQTLKSAVLYDFDVLIKKFIEAHTRLALGTIRWPLS